MSPAQPAGCPVYDRCGGCPWIGVPYAEQLMRKQQSMEDLFGSLCRVAPIRAMEGPKDCRNKVIVPAAPTEDGRSFYGIYHDGAYDLAGMRACPIMISSAKPVFEAVCDLIHPDGVAGSWEKRTIRHATIRTSGSTGQIMVTLVCRTHLFDADSEAIQTLVTRCPQITTVVENINDGAPCVVYGDIEQVLFGPGFIEDELLGSVFRISPRSFYQINPYQTPLFYQKALDLAGLSADQTALDAYCGTGTIGILASRGAREIIGVENNPAACADAVLNAARNKADNIRFCAGDATSYMRELLITGRRVDVVFLDPPRKGTTHEFLIALDLLAPARIVYISCNPQTQQRDCRILIDLGWNMRECCPFDAFPHTPHIESVVMLSKA